MRRDSECRCGLPRPSQSNKGSQPDEPNETSTLLKTAGHRAAVNHHHPDPSGPKTRGRHEALHVLRRRGACGRRRSGCGAGGGGCSPPAAGGGCRRSGGGACFPGSCRQARRRRGRHRRRRRRPRPRRSGRRWPWTTTRAAAACVRRVHGVVVVLLIIILVAAELRVVVLVLVLLFLPLPLRHARSLLRRLVVLAVAADGLGGTIISGGAAACEAARQGDVVAGGRCGGRGAVPFPGGVLRPGRGHAAHARRALPLPAAVAGESS